MDNLPSRERVTTIGQDGGRRFLQPAAVTGPFTRARMAVGWLLITIFAMLPWIEVGGYPAVFLDVEHRRFHLFGVTLGLGDLWLLFFVISGLGFTIYACTALLGRLWCGWACPQTVYLDHVFRLVDRWLEGDHLRRRKLDELPWSDGRKLRRRGLRALVYLVLCWAIAHIFLAYFVSIPGLYPMITGAPTAHLAAFVAMVVATGVLFFDFWWFREQLCLIICPYGRLQSALIDDDTITVGYDARRGEPRGRPSANVTAGDCVDCRRCVQVCPTGIDIRQGLQMECLACTACVDACDDVMTRLKRPGGLVRYASLKELEGRSTRLWRPRTMLYAVLFLLGVGVAGTAIWQRQDAGFKVTRDRGVELFQVSPRTVANVVRVKLENNHPHSLTFFIEALDSPVPVTVLNQTEGLRVASQQELTLPVTLLVDRTAYRGPFNLVLRLRSEDNQIQVTQKFRFLGPDPETLGR
jgi:cytochrome c oxidase accessory protein FixG